ncbi:MAG: THUMP domain-containing protein [Candidatus Binatia bacterium]|nr:THUMP domain-containing protein [Candidatus Binatia bacterium]
MHVHRPLRSERSNAQSEFAFFVTAARGTEVWVQREALALGAREAKAVPGGVHVVGPFATGYRLCLWSRVGQRVLLPLATVAAADAQALYEGAMTIDWGAHMTLDTRFEVECTAATDTSIRHTHFAALKVKDAIADSFRHRYGGRPSVGRQGVRLTVHVYLHGSSASLAIDLSGEPLYKRGYRGEQTEAPLKETLAAALLYAADWPERLRRGDLLVDPFCGSGTIVIEAALMAGNRAPGLTRTHFGFLAWKRHDAELWHLLVEEARQQDRTAQMSQPLVYGSDISQRALALAQEGAKRAGVGRLIRFARCDARSLAPPGRNGIVVTNPPYGVRLAKGDLDELYASLGDTLRRRFLGWTAFIFTGNPAAAKRIGLRPDRRFELWNGPIECRLLRFPISAAPVAGEGPHWRRSGK